MMMSDFMPGILFGLMIASLAYIWVPSERLSPEVFVKAEAACTANGGVKYLSPGGWMSTTSGVTCANGAKFIIEDGAP